MLLQRQQADAVKSVTDILAILSYANHTTLRKPILNPALYSLSTVMEEQLQSAHPESWLAKVWHKFVCPNRIKETWVTAYHTSSGKHLIDSLAPQFLWPWSLQALPLQLSSKGTQTSLQGRWRSGLFPTPSTGSLSRGETAWGRKGESPLQGPAPLTVALPRGSTQRSPAWPALALTSAQPGDARCIGEAARPCLHLARARSPAALSLNRAESCCQAPQGNNAGLAHKVSESHPETRRDGASTPQPTSASPPPSTVMSHPRPSHRLPGLQAGRGGPGQQSRFGSAVLARPPRAAAVYGMSVPRAAAAASTRAPAGGQQSAAAGAVSARRAEWMTEGSGAKRQPRDQDAGARRHPQPPAAVLAGRPRSFQGRRRPGAAVGAWPSPAERAAAGAARLSLAGEGGCAPLAARAGQLRGHRGRGPSCGGSAPPGPPRLPAAFWDAGQLRARAEARPQSGARRL